jgi:hypothetical protein
MQKVRNLNVKPVASPARSGLRGNGMLSINFKMTHQVTMPAATWKSASEEERRRLCAKEVLKWIAKRVNAQGLEEVLKWVLQRRKPCIDIDNKIDINSINNKVDISYNVSECMKDNSEKPGPLAVHAADAGGHPEIEASQSDPWANWAGWRQQRAQPGSSILPTGQVAARTQKQTFEQRPEGWVEVPIIDVD